MPSDLGAMIEGTILSEGGLLTWTNRGEGS
jgi:hypothetical protein